MEVTLSSTIPVCNLPGSLKAIYDILYPSVMHRLVVGRLQVADTTSENVPNTYHNLKTHTVDFSTWCLVEIMMKHSLKFK